jgi:hypothetical protein
MPTLYFGYHGGKKEKEEFSLVFMLCNTLGVRRSEVSVPQL